MYTPRHFEVSDREMILSFMQQYNFAPVITSSENIPKATHLPFIIENRAGDLVLVSHMAKANDQWKDFEKAPVLVVFSEPHAYISTSFYGPGDKVPTWNYVAIHAYGKAVILESDDEKKQVLEKMISAFHAPDLENYKSLPAAYMNKMLKGIVAFEINAVDLQAKFKMSQNRNQDEREHIITAFEKDGSAMEQTVAGIIRDVNKGI